MPDATQELPTDEPVGRLEPVVQFRGPMPTGVTVSRAGRIFVNFPKWGDEVAFTVAELRDGRPVPYPSPALNQADPEDPASGLVSVQSVVVDPADRLWILDTGSPMFRPTTPGGPKLVCVDLSLAEDGHLYVTANQLHRQARYQRGEDLRRKPYSLFRIRVDGSPVRLC